MQTITLGSVRRDRRECCNMRDRLYVIFFLWVRLGFAHAARSLLTIC
ncbi:hypothetical protein [Chroococcidiopsis sp. TS-821]